MGTERVVPVVVKVNEGGRVRSVKVGQAFVTDEEVVLSLEPMTLELEPESKRPVTQQQTSQLMSLEWMAERSRKILADPRKERWHADMRVQLARIEAEMQRLHTLSPRGGERAG